MPERTSIDGARSRWNATRIWSLLSSRRGILFALLALLVFASFTLFKIDGLLEQNQANLNENIYTSNALAVILQARSGTEALRDLAESVEPLSLPTPEFIKETASSHKHLALLLEAMAGPERETLSELVPGFTDLSKETFQNLGEIAVLTSELEAGDTDNIPALTSQISALEKSLDEFAYVLSETQKSAAEDERALQRDIQFYFIFIGTSVPVCGVFLFALLFFERSRTKRAAVRAETAQAEVGKLGRILDDSLNEIYILNGENLKFITANQSALNNMGYNLEELRHLTPFDFKLPGEPNEVMARLETLRESGADLLRFKTFHTRKDGSSYPIELNLQYFPDETPPVFVAIGEDISDRTEAQKALTAKTELVQLLHYLSAAANTASTPKDALEECLLLICAHLNWPVGHVYFHKIRDGEDRLVPSDIWNLENREKYRDFTEATRNTIFLPGAGLPGRAFLDKEPTWIPDIGKDNNFPRADALKECNLNTGFGLPILSQGNVTAVMEFFSHEAVKPDKALIQALRDMCYQLGRVFERKTAEDALQRLSHQTKNILDSAGEGILGLDAEGLCTFCNPAVARITGFPIEELIGQPLHDTLHHSKADGTTYPKEECPTFQAIQTGQACHISHDTFWRKDGSSFPVDYSCTPINENGEQIGAVVVMRDISESIATLEALSERESRLSSILESAVDCIIVINEKGTIESFNPAAENLFGYEAVEVIGQNVKILMPQPYRDEHDGYLHNYIETGQQKIIGIGREVIAQRKNGETFPIDLAVSEIKSGNRQIFTGVIRDISEQKEYETTLRNAKETAETADRIKSEFLAVMSHEVRTPMNGVLGMLELLMESTVSESQRDYINIARESGESLLSILNDILDFSKMEAGKLDLEIDEFDIHSAIDEVVQLLAPRAHAKGIEITAFVPVDVPIPLMGDEGRLRQVLLNLVGNSIKFTMSGVISVKATIENESADQLGLRVEVSDTGIGIPREAQDSLFEQFTQADPSHTRRFGGTGLGLAITRKIVSAMGGEIGFVSKEGEGSSFFFNLPLRKAPQSHIAIDKTPTVEGKKILVVEDNDTARLGIVDWLTAAGGQLTIATSGKEARGMLEKAGAVGETYDLAVIDHTLPDMTGTVFGKWIGEQPIHQGIKKVLTFSGATAGAVRAAGFDLVLNKPLVHMSFLRQITALLEGNLPPATANPVAFHEEEAGEITAEITNNQQSGKPGPTQPEAGGEKRKTATRILLAEDSPTNQMVARSFLEHAGYHIDCADNGKLAVKAIEEGAYDLIMMDISMPEMDGYAATAAIRCMTGGKENTPIIAITANVMEGDREKCLSAGMDDFIGKPFDKESLLEIVERWTGTIGQAETIEDTDGKTAPAESGQIEQGIINPGAIKQLESDIGPEIVPRLIRKFVEETTNRIPRMTEAMAKENYDALRDEAHTLKSSSLNFGAEGLSDQAKAIETACREGKIQEAQNLARTIETLATITLEALKTHLPDDHDDGST
ncbi:MAG: PAS domain S-box protein [Rhodospirillaceae bacterium]|nr:PAS domain S-box protein [Rhodospirillaceae bacterium]MBT5752125.1 PAS domain S-box protein [Rhodospirillaceae bacterium]